MDQAVFEALLAVGHRMDFQFVAGQVVVGAQHPCLAEQGGGQDVLATAFADQALRRDVPSPLRLREATHARARQASTKPHATAPAA
ncbi:MAG TPA: hypothetical protein EYP56_13595 [Planctomycetaceae bacterium]|nr:hypothetical protein [Planctomycetaceae bacterium]